jgi:hypothetical protein
LTNGLVELQITGFSSTGSSRATPLQSADWIIEGGGRRIEASGNPITVALPASQEPFQLTLANPNGEATTKRFDFPVNFNKIELIERK